MLSRLSHTKRDHYNRFKLIIESNNKHTDIGLMGLCVFQSNRKI